MADTYQTQFTRENVVELSKYIQVRIRDYAEQKQMKLDMFVIIVAMQQAAYEIALRSLTDSKEQAEAKIQAMLPISEEITKAIDAYRKEHESQSTEELLGAIFGSAIISEFFAHHRDEQLIAMGQAVQQASQQDVAPPVAEVNDAEIVE